MKRYPIRRPVISPEPEPGIIRLGFCDLKLGPCSIIHNRQFGTSKDCPQCTEFHRVVDLWTRRFNLSRDDEVSVRDPQANWRNAREEEIVQQWHHDCGDSGTRWIFLWSSCHPTEVRYKTTNKPIAIGVNELVIISNKQYQHRCRRLTSYQNEPRWMVVIRMSELPPKLEKLLKET